jgi:endonuclease/exonuclease/phosphatase family metal-dependent hydrolase
MGDLSLKILCWNLHGLGWPLSEDPRGRFDRVAAKIRELSPDIVLLQEVWLGSLAGRLSRALNPEWIPVCVRRRSGAPRGGLLTLVRASTGWRVCGAPAFHRFKMSAPVWRVWEGDGLGGKGILTVEVQHGEECVYAVNTHLQSQYHPIDHAAVREAQLIEVGEVVSRLDKSIPAIVAGDFNTDAREPLYSHIAALGSDLTATTRAQSNCGTTANSDEWIDFVVAGHADVWRVSAELELIANQRPDSPYSDHSGLCCNLTMTQRR